jgi:hypothetical protein
MFTQENPYNMVHPTVSHPNLAEIVGKHMQKSFPTGRIMIGFTTLISV